MDIKNYHAIWNDAWKFFKAYYEKIPLSDDDWTKLIELGDRFCKDHGSAEAAKKMAMYVLTMLDLEQKELEKKPFK